MAIWRGPITARRFRLVRAVPTETAALPRTNATRTEGEWARLRELVEARMFRAPERPIPGESVTGWTLPDNWLDVDFSDETRWRWAPFVALGFRIDKFEVPAARKKARVDQAVRAWCRDRGVDRCPATVKRQIQEDVELELVPFGRWRTKIVEVGWDTASDTVWSGSVTEGTNDAIRKLWHKTFGSTLEAWGPIPVTPEEGGSRGSVEHLLAFLLCASERNDGVLVDEGGDEEGKYNDGDDGDASGDRVLAGDRIGLSGGLDTNKVVVRGDSAPGSAEARRAIVREKLPIELAVQSVNGDGEPAWTAVLKGGLPDLCGLRFTMPDSHDRFGEDLVRERVWLLETAWAEVDRWGRLFARLGRDPDAVDAMIARLRLWAADDPVEEEAP